MKGALMGKHVDLSTVSRAGLLRRYAKLRGVTVESAERMTRNWSRTEFREVLESREGAESTYEPRHRREAPLGRTTTVQGITR